MTARYFRLIITLVLCIPLFSAVAQNDQFTVIYNDIRFDIPLAVASGVEVTYVEAENRTGDDIPQWATWPAHVRFDLVHYLNDWHFDTPTSISVYEAGPDLRTWPLWFAEMQSLQTLIDAQADLSGFTGAEPTAPDPVRLPYLPIGNSAQVFRTHPQYIETEHGLRGIRYITYYSQESAPITDKQVFYTFQGILSDGKYYVSVRFPVKTGILPIEIDYDQIDWDEFGLNYASYLNDIVEQLEAQPDSAFVPDLSTLDEMVSSLSIEN